MQHGKIFDKEHKKFSKVSLLSIILGVAGFVLIAIFLIINFVPRKQTPLPVPQSLSSSAASSSTPASSEISSLEESSEVTSSTVPYPTDKLFITKGRSDYKDGEMILRVPRLNLIAPVLDGTEPETLDRGVSLYDYAQLPGKLNQNTSMTAHRNIEFEYINTITDGDLIYLEYQDIEYTYEYEATTIVNNDDWSIIHCKDHAIVTLISCHPINSSKQRMAVTAKLISQKPIEKAESFASEASSAKTSSEAQISSKAVSSKTTVTIESEPVPQSSVPAVIRTSVLVPTADEIVSSSNAGVTIDASNTSEGYVMTKYDGEATNLKVQITGPDSVKYNYTQHPKIGYEVFPLTAGNGSYKVNIYENIEGSKYAFVYGETYDVQISDGLKPYLYPNQYVNFNSDSKTVAKGEALASGAKNEIEIVQNIYNYVIKNITYDDNKASDIAAGKKPGYLPVVDDILASGKGICFDYAAVMATMLRSQKIPTRLEVGYASSNIYHAWISVYTVEKGWINGIIQFDGNKWKLMDPTFASSSNSSKNIMKFIGNGSNYLTKYVY